MKNLAILMASGVLAACGGSDQAADEKPQNPVTEKADQLHDSIDKAHEVEGLLEDQKSAIDEALDEAERQPD